MRGLLASWGGSMETMRRQPSSRNVWAEFPSCRALHNPEKMCAKHPAGPKAGLLVRVRPRGQPGPLAAERSSLPNAAQASVVAKTFA